MDTGLYSDVFAYLERGVEPAQYTSTPSNFKALCRKYDIIDGSLYRNGKLVVKQGEEAELFKNYHFHSGIWKTYFRINSK